jgi:fructose-1,6-bisphosphatase I
MKDLDLISNAMEGGIIEISKLIRKFNPLTLGETIGSENSSGEKVKKLDLLCNNIFVDRLKLLSCVKNIASEEEDTLISVNDSGKYLVSFDPLDGSSNIDCNISVGTIFCVFEYREGYIKDGTNIVLSGYSIYGGSTQLVMCKNGSTNMYNLNPDNNTWYLINEDYKMKESGNIYSINEGYKYKYSNQVVEYTDLLIEKKYSARWVGSLVADFHRTLLKSGVVMYPSNKSSKNGKIRLLYEAYPLAYIIENSNGMSFDGNNSILSNYFPEDDIHKRVPIYFGSSYEMKLLK